MISETYLPFGGGQRVEKAISVLAFTASKASPRGEAGRKRLKSRFLTDVGLFFLTPAPSGGTL